MSNDGRNVPILSASKENPISVRDLCKKGGCGSQVQLVQTSAGGFVQWKCRKCGAVCALEEYDFRHRPEMSLSCPQCRKPLSRERDRYSNYIFVCRACGWSIRLADIVPDAL